MKISYQSFLFTLLAVAFSTLAFGQNADLNKTIATQAEVVASGAMRGDYKTLAKHTHPALIKLLGGEESYIEIVKETMDGLKEQGVEIVSVEIGDDIKVSEFENEMHCLVPKKAKVRSGEQTLLIENHLFGMSEDGGKHWVFIEADKLNSPAAKQILPDFKTNLTIPVGKPPVVVEEDK